MIRPLSSDQKTLVIDTLEQATDYSREMDPSAAIAKAAKATGLPETLLQYTVNAYNTGHSLANIKSGSTREEKAQTVPLAYLDKVMAEIYPDQPTKKASVSQDYKLSPTLLLDAPAVKKSASLPSRPAPEPPTLIELVNATKSARDVIGNKFQLYKRSQYGIQGYLENERHMSLADVIDQSSTAFGDLAKVVLEPLKDPYPSRQYSKAGMLVRINSQPFNLVKEALDHLESLHTLGIECGQREQSLLEKLDADDKSDDASVRKIAQLTRNDMFPQPKPVRVEPINKQAFSMGEYLLKQPGAFASTAKTAPKPAKPAAPAAAKPAEDKPGTGAKATVAPGKMYDAPQTEEIHALNKSVALNSLLRTDPDLQSYNRDQLSRAFNEIQMAFPNVAGNSITLRPFLQRHLAAGGLDDFALKNLADQERTLAQSKGTV